jgi:hypothetical protein
MIVVHAIEGRLEQVARAENLCLAEALLIPDGQTLRRGSRAHD